MKVNITFSALALIATCVLSSCSTDERVLPESQALNGAVVEIPQTEIQENAAFASAKGSLTNIPISLPDVGSYLAKEQYSTSEDPNTEPRNYWVDMVSQQQKSIEFQLTGLGAIPELEVRVWGDKYGFLFIDRTTVKLPQGSVTILGEGQFTKTGVVLEYMLQEGGLTTNAKVEVNFRDQ